MILDLSVFDGVLLAFVNIYSHFDGSKSKLVFKLPFMNLWMNGTETE